MEDQKKLDLKMAASKMNAEQRAEILDSFASSDAASASAAAASSSAAQASYADTVTGSNSKAAEAEAATTIMPSLPPVE